jgi:hypothetical protein
VRAGCRHASTRGSDPLKARWAHTWARFAPGSVLLWRADLCGVEKVQRRIGVELVRINDRQGYITPLRPASSPSQPSAAVVSLVSDRWRRMTPEDRESTQPCIRSFRWTVGAVPPPMSWDEPLRCRLAESALRPSDAQPRPSEGLRVAGSSGCPRFSGGRASLPARSRLLRTSDLAAAGAVKESVPAPSQDRRPTTAVTVTTTSMRRA